MEYFLPYLVILLCPLLHIFLMRGMHSKEHCEKRKGDN